MWCMYVTSPPVRLHQRHPVGLPSSGSGGQSEWYTPGAEDSKLNYQIFQKTQRELENCPENTGFTRNKPDSTGRNTTSPKCVPDTHLPLGKPQSITTTGLNTREHPYPTVNHLTTGDLGLTIIMAVSMMKI